ncbi:MAG TPA: ferrochelatase [Xanthobacteraceae bacterium]|nr:ferrochelatase [Xanthobacteraceae bacterium]
MNEISGHSTFTHRPADHPGVQSGSVGVLLVNLGTPDATDAGSVRRYLREFLHDKRVIEDDTIVWKFVLNAIILPLRPRRKGLDYEKIWNREKNESPLKTITRSQADKLSAVLTQRGKSAVVDWAMRYGNPSIRSRLSQLAAQGCDRILVVPLYPQYAAATSATVCDEVFRALMDMRWQPTLRVAAPYFDEPAYIEALAASLEAHLKMLAFAPDLIIASFHGIPMSYFQKGDPYYCHCAKTTRLLRERLRLDESKLIMTFQSRFGRAEWLKPYTDMTVKELAARGVRNLVVITPGFSADCLETLEEIAGENAEYFRHAGGENFAAVPCLNDSEPGMRVIEAVVLRELQGWA